ncbi:MAG: exo-alpha-sialidase [Gemmatimonadota bacterium]|nr:exo-alpha-sialidase [Gemmatimonadota bacterium]MDE2873361.1 exo-alpha-sialidase [Gemmatimonadota bacterium]
MGVRLLVGTAKGGFWVTSDDRSEWEVAGPFFKGWKVTAGLRLRDGSFVAAVASDIYGPAIFLSPDGDEWEQVADGPAYPDGDDRRLRQIWTLRENRGKVYAGVQDAGVFTSGDGGRSWQPVPGLNEHETRGGWMPGAGGLCCHAFLFDRGNPDRMWCGISAVGVFRTDDGGASWIPKNRGVYWAHEHEEFKEIGHCVHGLAQDPGDPGRIYRQDHSGMYRSRDGGELWEKNENGLATAFGFPIVLDRASRYLFAVPLEADQYRLPVGGALKVVRSTDGGDSWHTASEGLPAEHAYGGVLRGAMAVDDLEPGGVYMGTTSGTLHVSRDLGESWTNLAVSLPRVLHVSAWVE